MMDTIAEKHKKLVSYLQNLAKIRTNSSLYTKSVERVVENVFFALDTNILETIFHDDEDNLSILYGSEFCEILYGKLRFFEHLFNEITNSTPIFVLPGHDKEVIGFFDKLISYWEQIGANHEEVLTKLNYLEEQIDDDELDSCISQLVALSLKKKILSLFKSAIADGKVQASSNYEGSLFSKEGERVVAGINLYENNSRAIANEQRLRMKWNLLFDKEIDKLDREKMEKRHLTCGADISALIRLESINAKLDNLGMKLVLLTMDDFLISICQKHRASYSSQQENDFADEYVWAPHALYERENFFVKTKDCISDNLSLTDIINFSLAPLISNGSNNFKLTKVRQYGSPELYQLNNVALSALQEAPESTIKLRQSIKILFQPGLDKELSELAQVQAFSSSKMRVKYLQEYNQQEIDSRENELDEMISSAIAFGVYFSKQIEARINTFRRVPTIYFDSFPKTTEIVQKIIEGNAQNLDYVTVIKHIEELDHEDGTQYAKFLATGVIFASVGLYRIAQTCAKKAIKISIGQAGNFKNITGREAYFFKSFLDRVLAVNKKQILYSRQVFNGNYIHALQLDLNKYEDSHNGTELDERREILNLRTENEEIASILHLLYFNFFNNIGDVQKNRNDLDEYVRRLNLRLKYFDDMQFSQQHLERINMKLKTSCYINLFSALFLRYLSSKEHKNDIKLFLSEFYIVFERHVGFFRNQINQLEDVYNKSIMYLMSYMIAAVVGKDTDTSIFVSVNEWLSNISTDSMTTSSFSKFEQERLRNFVKNFSDFRVEIEHLEFGD